MASPSDRPLCQAPWIDAPLCRPDISALRIHLVQWLLFGSRTQAVAELLSIGRMQFRLSRPRYPQLQASSRNRVVALFLIPPVPPNSRLGNASSSQIPLAVQGYVGRS